MAIDYTIRRHLEWLGYLQPVGLVVSPPALVDAQAFPNEQIIPDHNRFLECVAEAPLEGKDETAPAITDVPRFCTHVLGWEPADLAGAPGGPALPETLEVTLTDYNETLRPTYAVPELGNVSEGQSPWMMLIQVLKTGTDLDTVAEADERHWQATPQARFERLLRETQVPIGLLVNGTHLRLVYAPRGESSGHVTFPVYAMTEVAGRPIFAALHMLLSAERLFTLPDEQRLPAILSRSRRYQNQVSTKLAEQVLAALYELLRGFQGADDHRKGDLLRDVLRDDPNHVYGGLLAVLMRLVFVLYAEDRALLSNDEVYLKFYAVIGLFERLREDAGRYADTMDHRYGAWAQLLTLFRLVHDGARHGGLRLPARKGYLFDPDRYPFLEGRPRHSRREPGARIEPPRISDGVVYRVLRNLLILDGERLSYRTLDVEQIGSVYETIMGFNLEVAAGRSIAVKPTKPHGAPTTINLEELLAARPGERARWLKEQSDQAVTGQAAAALKDAETPEDIVAALEKKVAREATPSIVPPGAMVLQPSDERRRSGSHYTPRSLTEPIVRTTLRPILESLIQIQARSASESINPTPPLETHSLALRARTPTPDQILELKVCDPAMGSGAFLVEACRQLAEALVSAWHAHDCVPGIPPDEDELLHARRIVAQRCLYGVDKNPMAVDLARLSLWLATLAKDHPFTFLDHALRCGDSLVGLSRKQIEGFHWRPDAQRDFARGVIEDRVRRVAAFRREIREAADSTPDTLLRQKLALAEEALNPLRFYGDLVVSAFFEWSNDKQRKAALEERAEQLSVYLTNPTQMGLREPLEAARKALVSGEKAVQPFHWEIEFPEVFDIKFPGFDAFIGNPPFLGGTRISEMYGMTYFQWLVEMFPPCGHHCDLVAYFFRRCFDLLKAKGCLGLIATNTVSQGDTREGGLREILNRGGTVYEANRRFRWPGLAAVVVSIVHIAKRCNINAIRLNACSVSRINAFLLEGYNDNSPARLCMNPYFSLGCKIYGQGFLFDDTDDSCTPLAERKRILSAHPEYSSQVLPYIGGEELNSHPQLLSHRFAINISNVEDEEGLNKWGELRSILETKVKPERMKLGSNPNNTPLKRRWWAYQAHRPELYQIINQKQRVLCLSRVGQALAFAFLPTGMVHSEQLVIFDLDSYSAFSILQSRLHETWARFFASSMKDDMRYTPSDCFETFPFPKDFETNPALETAGQAYYEFRAALMVRNNEGLTKTYNRFHDPDERSPDILKLRELHAAMDRAVLDAYGWTDLKPTCEFLLDYEEDEDEDEPAGKPSRKKKPWRYRWPDDFRDEVLARLLDLNRRRAEEEAALGAANSTSTGRKRPAASRTGRSREPANDDPRLPGIG